MHSIAVHDVAELGGSSSVLARQKRDHVELDQLLEQVQRSTDDEQDKVLMKIWRLVFRHAYAEETVLWPAMRAAVPDGDALTSRVEQEHQEINELAAALDSAPSSPPRQELIERLVTLLRQDVRDEEDVLLPRLGEAMSTQQLRRLGRTWEIVRRTAPTRPHPAVSRRPPGNIVAALPLAVIDHARDGLDSAARRSTGTTRAAAGQVSRALAGAAARIERLGLLRVGEDASTRTRRT